ncbi:26263_t:CDS:2 [Gigaspora margarita]|uniref:26263_t:CDS:1 n=1 Tax=Gigaspora margarita TaxID=4874 RepID=A0ABN7UMU1_GIGMA|nr:26263_t:CDS:2 [Gigaspora margarita]
MDVEITVPDKEKGKTKSYIDSQLYNYIDKLNSNENFNNIVKPNTTDSNEWINYLKKVRHNKVLDKEAKRKYIKQKLKKTIPTRSSTQSNRYKQVYDHIIDLVARFESEKIPIDIWLPVLGKICISFRFLHESNFKRKKTYELYEKFIELLITKCLKSIIKVE